MNKILLVLVLFLASCSQFADKPNATKAFIANQAIPIGERLDVAEKQDLITNEQEDEMIDKLIYATDLLRPGAIIDLEHCQKGDSPAQCRQRLLNQVEALLLEASRE